MQKVRCKWANASPELAGYHDSEYGFRIKDDFAYFERLTLELFQAGLSWATILRKREAFRNAFDGFDFYKISRYGKKKIGSLLNDPSIIRNRLKIESTVYNAKKFIEIVEQHGTFDKFMKSLDINDRDGMVREFKKRFKFMGPLIVEEFMMSAGFWEVKHQKECFLFKNPV